MWRVYLAGQIYPQHPPFPPTPTLMDQTGVIKIADLVILPCVSFALCFPQCQSCAVDSIPGKMGPYTNEKNTVFPCKVKVEDIQGGILLQGTCHEYTKRPKLTCHVDADK